MKKSYILTVRDFSLKDSKQAKRLNYCNKPETISNKGDIPHLSFQQVNCKKLTTHSGNLLKLYNNT